MPRFTVLCRSRPAGWSHRPALAHPPVDGWAGRGQRPATTAPARAGGLARGARARAARPCRRCRIPAARGAGCQLGSGGQSAHRLATTLEWMEIDRRWAAVGALTGRIAVHLATLPTAPMPEDHAWLAPHRADPAGYRRAIDLDRRLDHILLRLAGDTIRASRIEISRGMAPAPAAGPPMAGGGNLQSSLAFGPSIRLFPPIAGWPGDPEPSPSGRRPARTHPAVIDRADRQRARVRSRRLRRSVPGLGPLLIIDRGGGYHAVLVGVTRLDVREGAQRSCRPVVGEIDARGDGPARLHFELRYRGVPIDPAAWLAAHQDKVRS